MARITQIVLTCDVDGDETPAEETVRFGLDGREYEIELCARHHKELNGFMGPFVQKGRKIDGTRPRRRNPRASGGVSSAASSPASTPAARPGTPARAATPARRVPAGRRADAQAIRVWARAHNMTVSDRGRISAEVSQAYAAAHR
ncbi:MAG: histone-like nucleoid-structuring protein Lsr2 [Acidimicrobiales bacterium]